MVQRKLAPIPLVHVLRFAHSYRCRIDAVEQEYQRLMRRFGYLGGKKARAAARRLCRDFADYVSLEYR